MHSARGDGAPFKRLLGCSVLCTASIYPCKSFFSANKGVLGPTIAHLRYSLFPYSTHFPIVSNRAPEPKPADQDLHRTVRVELLNLQSPRSRHKTLSTNCQGRQPWFLSLGGPKLPRTMAQVTPVKPPCPSVQAPKLCRPASKLLLCEWCKPLAELKLISNGTKQKKQKKQTRPTAESCVHCSPVHCYSVSVHCSRLRGASIAHPQLLRLAVVRVSSRSFSLVDP